MNSSDFYLQFENKFRGSREEIHKRLQAYDCLLTKISSSSSALKVLDIGCGRGEWLSKCRQLGFDCSGIEINPSMAKICIDSGFQIYNDDVLNVLPTLPEGEFNIVSIFHVIEHIGNPEIQNIFRECKRILSSNGVLIIETPSIDNLNVSSRQFYLDPTHINPINPDGLIFILDYLGFDSTKYFFINPGQFVNDYTLSLKKVLAGTAQDLCILASNSKLISHQIFKEEKSIIKSEYISLTTLDAAVDFDQQTQKLRNQIDQLKVSNDHLKKQINFLLYRQDKIFNSFLFKVLRKSKTYFLNIFIIVKTLLKKALRRLISVCSFFYVIKYFFVKLFGILMKILFIIALRFFGDKIANRTKRIIKTLIKKRTLINDNLNTNLVNHSSYRRFLCLTFQNSRRSKEIYRLLNKNN